MIRQNLTHGSGILFSWIEMMSEKDSNIALGRELREAHGGGRNIRLPESDTLKFSLKNEIEIEITEDSIKANMQTNGASFEGWAASCK